MPPPLNISSDLSKVAISSSLCTSILQAGRESPLTKWLLRLGPRTPAQQQVRVMRAMCAFPQTRHRAVCTVIADGSWVVCDVVAYARSCTRVCVCARVQLFDIIPPLVSSYPRPVQQQQPPSHGAPTIPLPDVEVAIEPVNLPIEYISACRRTNGELQLRAHYAEELLPEWLRWEDLYDGTEIDDTVLQFLKSTKSRAEPVAALRREVQRLQRQADAAAAATTATSTSTTASSGTSSSERVHTHG